MLRSMDLKTAGYLILYGAGLIVLGLVGYLSNPEKAKTALIVGGTFGALSILWGVLGAREVRWIAPVALVTTALLIAACAWRASVGWLAVLDGQSEKLFAAALITAMLAASAAMLPSLLRALKKRPAATPQSDE
ncbi:MAG: hypothetical protein EXS35_09915 [Pedosphaera sp.]|nr:hypothetical protein [Pedosphaera sp.]